MNPHATAFLTTFVWTLIFGLAVLSAYWGDKEMFRHVLTSALIGLRFGVDHLK
jgi:hypothetical protein